MVDQVRELDEAESLAGVLGIAEGQVELVVDVLEAGHAAVNTGDDDAAGVDLHVVAAADGLEVVELVVVAVLEGAVGVDAGLMGEGVGADARRVEGDGNLEGVGDVVAQAPGFGEIEALVEEAQLAPAGGGT